jgi:hypothetical protein
MVEIEYRGKTPISEVAAILGELIGPRRYWLHNRIGGDHWEIQPGHPCRIIVEDDTLATFITLKLT